MRAEASDDLVTFEGGAGLLWQAEAGFASVIHAEIAPRIDELERAPGTVVLKKNMVRMVLRVPIEARGEVAALAGPSGRVIVKRYRVAGLQDWVKYAVKPSRAKAEWDVGRGLDRAGIPTAVPLAYAERRVGGVLRDAALVTREITGAVHLNAYVEAHMAGPDAAAAAMRRRLYDDLARLVRRMHDAGFIHNDFHGGNLLVNGEPSDPHLHVIDLHSVTRPAHPSEGGRWFDFLKLLHSMLTCSTAEERVRICSIYEAGSSGRPSGTRIAALLQSGRLSAELEPALLAMEAKRVRSRTDRSLARSSKFEVTTIDGFRVHHLRTIDAAAAVALLAPHARDVAAKKENVLKSGSRSALTRQTLGTGDAAQPVIVKQYRTGGWADRAKNAVRTPRAVASWVAGNGLLVRGFDAATPLALILRGRGLGLSDSYVVMEDLGDGTRADLVVLQRYAGAIDDAGRAEKRALVEAAADLVRRLHASGVYHGDLKAVNLFLRGAGRTGELDALGDGGAARSEAFRFVLADYDRVEFGASVRTRRRIKNLAQLSASVPVCISLTDRLRFFRAYAKDEPEVAGKWKEWFRRVIGECRRKIVVRMAPIE